MTFHLPDELIEDEKVCFKFSDEKCPVDSISYYHQYRNYFISLMIVMSN